MIVSKGNKVMNITQIPTNYTNNYQRRNYVQVNFGCNTTAPLKSLQESTMLNADEIVANMFKLANKIKFVSEILGDYGKTINPIPAKIGDAIININIDKSPKNKIRINLFSDTDEIIYKYSPELQMYMPVKGSAQERQSMDIIVNKKDKRMMDGQLNVFDCIVNFSRNIKTGKREINSSKPFVFVPNLYECKDIRDVAVQFYQNSKEANIVTSLFFNMFANLTKVKPEISLIK